MRKSQRKWFSWEPETEERMVHIGGHYTACEVLRQAYGKTDDPEIRMLLRIATTMAKCLANRLYEYEGSRYGAKVYPLNPLWLHMKREQIDASININKDDIGGANDAKHS